MAKDITGPLPVELMRMAEKSFPPESEEARILRLSADTIVQQEAVLSMYQRVQKQALDLPVVVKDDTGELAEARAEVARLNKYIEARKWAEGLSDPDTLCDVIQKEICDEIERRFDI